MDERELGALQAALVHVLRRASSPAEVLAQLAAAPLARDAQRWIAASDPRSIETAIALVRRWAELHEEPPPAGR